HRRCEADRRRSSRPAELPGDDDRVRHSSDYYPCPPYGLLIDHRDIQVPFDFFQVRLQHRSPTVPPQQRAEASELLNELRGTVRRALFQVIDAEERIMIQAGLPESGLDPVLIRQ